MHATPSARTRRRTDNEEQKVNEESIEDSAMLFPRLGTMAEQNLRVIAIKDCSSQRYKNYTKRTFRMRGHFLSPFILAYRFLFLCPHKIK